MNVHRVILLVVVLLALACARLAAQAEHEIVREDAWNRSLMHTQIVARYKGRPVLVFFAEDWCGYCESIEKTLLHPELRDVTRRFFLVKLSPGASEETARKLHVGMHHQIVLLDWSGKEVGRLDDDITPKTVALKVTSAAAASDLLAAGKLVELNYFKDAAARFAAVAAYAKDGKQIAEAKQHLAAIAERAGKQLLQIRELVRLNRLGEAADACEEYLETFPADMNGDEVKKVLDHIRTGRPVPLPNVPRPVDPGPPDRNQAALLLEKGMVQEWDRHYYDASETYLELVKLHPKSDAAKEAEKRLKLLIEDLEMKVIVAQQKADKFCQRWMEMATLYEEQGLKDDAITYYNRVITSFPTSGYADEARKAVERIRR